MIISTKLIKKYQKIINLFNKEITILKNYKIDNNINNN